MNNVVIAVFENKQYYANKTVKGLVQWDTNQFLKIQGLDVQNVCVYFSLQNRVGNSFKAETISQESEIIAKVPKFVLEKDTEEEAYRAYAFVCIENEEFTKTIGKIVLNIKTKPKPDDYVYTEDEIKTYSKKVNLPIDEEGKIDNGEVNQFLVSNGDGTTSWKDKIFDSFTQIKNYDPSIKVGYNSVYKSYVLYITSNVDVDNVIFINNQDEWFVESLMIVLNNKMAATIDWKLGNVLSIRNDKQNKVIKINTTNDYADITYDDNGNRVDTKIGRVALQSQVLTTWNITEYTPTSDYHPATKKYVDDLINQLREELKTT